jgi:hypothetical protein
VYLPRSDDQIIKARNKEKNDSVFLLLFILAKIFGERWDVRLDYVRLSLISTLDYVRQAKIGRFLTYPKSKFELIELNLKNDYVRLMFCSTFDSFRLGQVRSG